MLEVSLIGKYEWSMVGKIHGTDKYLTCSAQARECWIVRVVMMYHRDWQVWSGMKVKENNLPEAGRVNKQVDSLERVTLAWSYCISFQ